MMPIGICNINAQKLEDLLLHDEPQNSNVEKMGEITNRKARVNYVQNEYHPFLCTDVPRICKKNTIHFEAHSTMWGNLDDYETVLNQIEEESKVKGEPKKIIDKPRQSTPQLAIAFAANVFKDVETPTLSGSGNKDLLSVCFTTTNYAHLVHICKTRQISPDLLFNMRQMCHYKRVVRYKGSNSEVNTNWVESCDMDYIRNNILPKIKTDIDLFTKGRIPSDLCTKIPKHFHKRGKVHSIIAELLYSEFLKEQESMTQDQIKSHYFGNKYRTSTAKGFDELDRNDKDFANMRLALVLKKMRIYIEEIKKGGKQKKKFATCTIKAITNPEALPVDDFPDASEFDDLNSYIMNMSLKQKQENEKIIYTDIRFKYGTLNIEDGLDSCQEEVKNDFMNSSCDTAVRFRYGTLNSDGRLDLCKQGVKNAFLSSCKAVAQGTRFKHGTLNSDGRLDLCKQGVRNAFNNICDAVIEDGNVANIRFQHGTINSDGRLDLCKQGVQKAFTNTCEAVARDGDPTCAGNGRALIQHYLLGNNIIGDDRDGLADTRISALCNLIKKRPDIETWYLAGNALSPTYIAAVADALKHTRAKYLWFKMNPIKEGCSTLAELIQNNQNIELLDLFNCGIGDSGLSSFCNTLVHTGITKLLTSNHNCHFQTGAAGVSSVNDLMTLVSETQNLYEDVPTKQKELVNSFRVLNYSKLKHFYLGINGITELGIDTLFCIFALLSENIESIYIHSNPVTDEGINLLYGKLTSYGVTFPKLKRLSIGSCGLTDKSLPNLREIIKLSPSLVSLDLSSYKSTNYFGLTHNTFNNIQELKDIASALKCNATRSGYPDRNYIGLQNTLRYHDQNEVKALVDYITANLEMNVNGIQYKNQDGMKSGMLIHKKLTKRELSEIKDPYPALDYIQSIYRNTMKL
jgi:hypothetical protein